MKAVRVHQTGGPDVLGYEEIQTPVPRAGEVLVRLAAVGVNFIDINQRMGRYPLPLPFTPGLEASGTVEAVAPDVKGFAVGDRVAYADVAGAYAEFAAVRADRLVPLPAGLDFEQATAAMLQGMTAESLTTGVYPLREGDTCLVHAAAGGVESAPLSNGEPSRGSRDRHRLDCREGRACARRRGAPRRSL